MPGLWPWGGWSLGTSGRHIHSALDPSRRRFPEIGPVGVDELEQISQDLKQDCAGARLLYAERRALLTRRKHYQLDTKSEIVGLALSGGGIRSATFSLGVLQALAERDLLKHVDYLSTVSGGGYIGSSLQWWWSGRSGEKRSFGVRPDKEDSGITEADRFPYGTDDPSVYRDRAGLWDGPKLLRNLKERGNYLTPGRGIGLLSLSAVVLRSMVLSMCFWIPLITGAIFLLEYGRAFGWALLGAVGVLAIFVVVALLYSLFTGLPLLRGLGYKGRRFTEWYAGRLFAAALALAFVSSIDVTSCWFRGHEGCLCAPPLAAVDRAAPAWIDERGWVELGDRVDRVVTWVERVEARIAEYADCMPTPIATATATSGTGAAATSSGAVVSASADGAVATASARGPGASATATAPGALGENRGANGPDGVGQMVTGWAAGLGGIAGALLTYFRTMRGAVGRVRKLPGLGTNPVGVLSAGLVIFGVLLFCHGLAELIIATDRHADFGWTLLVFLVVGIVVNINHISAHRMYRDRLMEAFMPSFDDARCGRSHVAPPAADKMRMNDVDPGKGPFPIVNTNLVLVNSAERRRNIRGGDSFVLTPIYCGSNATGWTHCDKLMGGRMTLPTAMAISGAAANPNTGAGGVGLTRNRIVSALMALLGLRLGYWIPTWSGRGLPSWPPNHVWPGISAVLPRGHTENSWFLELSDGGHFENLGLYELVRRKARLIIVCDGAQDPEFAFEDLQRAQRRILADFGARLELDIAQIERLIPAKTDHRFPEAGLKLADAGHAVGRITYADHTEENRSTAIFVYIKTTLVDDLPLALLGYRGANPTFPDQTTGDQFFDEEQFEAYRELGFILAERMLNDVALRADIHQRFGW